jgi:hydrogenase nickel incorporation protein HypA/HybF
MHEYSIVESLMARVDQVVADHGARKVHRIELVLGELSGVEAGLLLSAYSLFRERGPYRDTELHIETVAASWACPACQATTPRAEALRCTACGRPMRLVRGDEIVLQRLEMEVD